MIIEIKIPEMDKDAEEYLVAFWLKENGSTVKKNEDMVELESNMDSYIIASDEEGILEIVAQEGSYIKPNDVLCNIITTT